jgi:hypothetical protein
VSPGRRKREGWRVSVLAQRKKDNGRGVKRGARLSLRSSQRERDTKIKRRKKNTGFARGSERKWWAVMLGREKKWVKGWFVTDCHVRRRKNREFNFTVTSDFMWPIKCGILCMGRIWVALL